MKIKLLVSFIILLVTVDVTFSQQGAPGNFMLNLTPEEKAGGVLTPEILWKYGRLGDPQISPDGKAVIFTVTRYNVENNSGNTEIFLLDLSSEEMKRLTETPFPEYNPRWMPKGKGIGYISTGNGSPQLWEMAIDGSGKRQVTSIDGGINSFEYSPGGKHILYTTDVKVLKTTGEIYPDLPKANVRLIDDLMFRHWNGWSDEKFSHIFVADYLPGKVSNPLDIMEGEAWDSPLAPYFDHSEITWGPLGERVAYTCKKLYGKEYALSTDADIYIYHLDNQVTENLTEGMEGYDKYPVISPDGQKLAWISMETPGYESDKGRLFIHDFKTREKTYLTAGFDQNAASVTWDEDSENIYFISGKEATFQVYKLNVQDKNIDQLTTGNHDYQSIIFNGESLIGTRMSMSMATELYAIDLNTTEERQLSFINKNIYDNIKMGKVEERWIKTTDNKDMLTWVIYPPNFDPAKKYPALLYCQGGPQSAVSQFFSYRWNFQLMAAHDYIIVAPNRRGLPTFGQTWNEQISLDYGGQNIQDYLTAIDEVKKEPYVDEDRLGAVGASYGGYSVFFLAGHHQKRFKAFISHCGMFNFESFYGATEELFFPNHDIGGPYWQLPKPGSYKFSPHLYVKNWDTPILIIAGEYDFRIPYTESLQAFTAAQLMDVPSRLLIFPDETHFVLKPQNAILWQREFFSWLDKWLREGE
jgi:dipeptidyl aminopeptidase/acylaminoacyl peptidase